MGNVQWTFNIDEYIRHNKLKPTILIFEKFNNPSSVKFGVPSSMNDRSARYMPII